MSDAIKLKVLRPCWILGRVAEAGAIVKLPPDDAQTAVNSGRCEPADEFARAELKVAAAAERDKLAHRLARLPAGGPWQPLR